MVKIDRSQVLNSAKWSSKGKNHKTVIVIHETANRSVGAGAYAHHRLQYNGNPREASWHYQVDDKVAVQTYSEDLRLWHAGSVAIPFTISMEICVNADSDYNKAILNAIDLCVDIAKRNAITVNNLVTHMFYTGKNCPTQLLSGRYGWTYTQFVRAVQKGLSGETVSKPNIPKQPKKTDKSIKELADEVEKGLHGNGADRMKSLGYNYEAVQNEINKRYGSKVDSGTKPKESHKQRINRLVKEVESGVHGNGNERKRKLGKDYSEVQNIINRKYSKSSNVKRGKSIGQMASEVIKGIHGTGHSQRRKSLGINNTTYQKVRNEVNRRLK